MVFADSLRRLAHDYPHAYGARPRPRHPTLRALDTSLAPLESAGLNRERAAEMVRTLIAYAARCAILELLCPAPAGETELEQLVRADARPAFRRTRAIGRSRPLMASCDMNYHFELGLDLILTDVEARL